MKLQEIFAQLSSGELSMLSIGGQEQGVINEANYPNLVNHVNLALSALFRRFIIREGNMKLQLVPGRTLYKLSSEFGEAAKRSKEPVRYILDLDNPFEDDLLKVEEVKTDLGAKLFINDYTHPLGVTTPMYNQLLVPEAIVSQHPELPDELKTEFLSIKYRASHPTIKVGLGYFDPERVEVELPPAYLTALLYFIASRLHIPIGIQGEGQVGNLWFTKYEAECARLSDENLQIDQGIYNTRLTRGGWV